MRDYKSAIADALQTLIASATAAGPNDVGALASSLDDLSRKLETQRDEMTCEVVNRCSDCGKRFAVTMTVKREREWGGPENCPPCWNTTKGRKREGHTTGDGVSIYTSSFHYVSRAEIATAANAVAASSRYGSSAPRLTESSSVETLCQWLQWCDPNGCHTPELAAIENFDPYTLDDAWDALAEVVKD